ncbi:MFS transporter [Actinocrispum wychmicini]|uniref:Putative MFS family arabinose efflux permease n=1 Tax=Actinocrispum wychmicini TaxID=1213861 RepID=A0A4R2IH47_9PSEU|nr:MFS transporter [Actinocrispum wychmicini]TCO43787.1 putative MFS family arabinose efflux permease [Actinocrispum wychmicini]
MEVERPATFRATFAVPEFRGLWFAEVQSVLGDRLARVALSVLVYEITGSPVWPAVVYALTYLPDLVAGPVLAGLADRYPRRAVMVTADLFRAVLVGLMAVPGMPFVALAALLVCVQFAQAPFTAAQAAMLPTILPGDRYVVGQSVRQITTQTSQLVGFALGGVVVAGVGMHMSLVLDAITFAISAVIIRLTVAERVAPQLAEPRAGRSLRRLAAGARTIWRDPRLRALVALAWLAGAVTTAEGLAVPYAGEIGGGAVTAGVLLAAHPAGTVVGTAVVGRWLAPSVRLRVLGPLAVMAVVPLLGYAFRPGLVVTAGLLIASGACASYQVIASSTFMRLVPDEGRAQAFGLAGSGLIAVQGLGVLAGGGLVALLGSPAMTVAAVAAVGVVAALPAVAAWRRARRANSW